MPRNILEDLNKRHFLMVKRLLRRGRRRVKRVKRGDGYYKSLANRIMRAQTSRTWRGYYAGVFQISQKLSAYPIVTQVMNYHIGAPYFTPADISAMMADLGKSSEALATLAVGDRFTACKMKQEWTVRNVALNPCYLHVQVFTPNKNYQSYKLAADTDYDSYNERIMSDNYFGWSEISLAADLSAELAYYNTNSAHASYSGTTVRNPLSQRNNAFLFGATKYFRQRHTRVQNYKVLLQPGQSFVFKVHSRQLSTDYDDMAANDRLSISGTTKAVVFTAHGDLGATANSVADPPVATTGRTNFELSVACTAYASVYKQNIQKDLRAVYIDTASTPAANTVMYGVSDDAQVA